MPHHLPISEVIKLGDISVPLSANYQYQGELFGPRLGQTFPLTIAIVTDALRWHYESFPPISITDAVGSITVTDVGNNGDNIAILVNDVQFGLFTLGNYTKQPSDTTLNGLAANIAASLTNLNGYVVSVQNNVITITVRPGLGSSMNGGNRLQAIINVPTITATKLLPFTGQVGFNSASQFFEIDGTYLYGFPGNITITSPSLNFQVSNDNITFGSSTTVPFNYDTIHNVKVYVRFSPTVAGNSTTNLEITGGGVQSPVLVFATGTALAAASLNATPLAPFPTTPIGSNSASQTSNLTGANLVGAPGNVTITAPNVNFQVSKDNVNFGSSIVVQFNSATLSSTPFYVRFSPTGPGSVSGNFAISGGGASTTLPVSGVAASPSLTATPVTPFINTPISTFSTSKTFTLTGANLTGAPGPITITAPSTDFQVSKDNIVFGPTTTINYSSSTLSPTTLYVRFSPQSTGTKSGNVSISGGGANTTVAVTGLGVVEFILQANNIQFIKFNRIETLNGFSILWNSADPSSLVNYPAIQTNIVRNYAPSYTGNIKIQVTDYADVEIIDIAGGPDAPQPANPTTVTITQTELVKLTNLLKFYTAQNAFVSGVTTLNINRSLTNLQMYNSDIVGSIEDLPTQLVQLDIRDSTGAGLTGNINTYFGLRNNANFFWVTSLNTLQGNISSFPSTLKYFVTSDTLSPGIITGTFSSISSLRLVYFVCNGSNITGSINDLDWTDLQWIEIIGIGTKTGDIDAIPSYNPNLFQINIPTNSSGITGNLSSFPNSLNYLNAEDWTVTGTTATLPTSLGTFVLGPNATLTGPAINMPSGMRQILLVGNNHNISGTLNDLPPDLRVIAIIGDTNTIGGYPTAKVWGAPSGASRVMNYFSITGASIPSLNNQSQVNQLMIDFDAVPTWAQGSSFPTYTPSITYKGIVPTPPGLAAKNNLIARGVPVTNV